MTDESLSESDRRGKRIDAAIANYLQRLDNGEACDIESFISDYPDLREELLAFISDMKAVGGGIPGASPATGHVDAPRHVSKDVALTALEQGMHIRCPHCHNAMEVIEDISFRDVECPSCGSHFSLIGSDTATASGRQKARKLAHFRLIEQLGMGTFGSVWKARDTTLDRLVAIKIPRKEQLHESDVESFLREARAAAQLHVALPISKRI